MLIWGVSLDSAECCTVRIPLIEPLIPTGQTSVILILISGSPCKCYPTPTLQQIIIFFLLKSTLSKCLCNKARFGRRCSIEINKIAFPTFARCFFQFYCLLITDFSTRRQVSPFLPWIFLNTSCRWGFMEGNIFRLQQNMHRAWK